MTDIKELQDRVWPVIQEKIHEAMKANSRASSVTLLKTDSFWLELNDLLTRFVLDRLEFKYGEPIETYREDQR